MGFVERLIEMVVVREWPEGRRKMRRGWWADQWLHVMQARPGQARSFETCGALLTSLCRCMTYFHGTTGLTHLQRQRLLAGRRGSRKRSSLLYDDIPRFHFHSSFKKTQDG